MWIVKLALRPLCTFVVMALLILLFDESHVANPTDALREGTEVKAQFSKADAAKFTTGTSLVVDGGFIAG